MYEQLLYIYEQEVKQLGRPMYVFKLEVSRVRRPETVLETCI